MRLDGTYALHGDAAFTWKKATKQSAAYCADVTCKIRAEVLTASEAEDISRLIPGAVQVFATGHMTDDNETPVNAEASRAGPDGYIDWSLGVMGGRDIAGFEGLEFQAGLASASISANGGIVLLTLTIKFAVPISELRGIAILDGQAVTVDGSPQQQELPMAARG